MPECLCGCGGGGGQISMIYDNMGIVYYRATNESPNQMNSLVAILDL